jgi:nucleotide-binding universal stress UspA family protein
VVGGQPDEGSFAASLKHREEAMSPTAIVIIGVLTAALLILFVYVSFQGIKTAPPGVAVVHGLLPVAAGAAIPLETPASHPLKVLVAVDGSPCSDRAVQSVAMRPWPDGSEVEIVTVPHTRVPGTPDAPLLMMEAAHVDALEAERLRAPERARRAEKCLGGKPGLLVTSAVLEGNPAEVILEEAERWGADLVVVGSHGYGPVKRRVLGSVSQAVALQATCSVEIVRCPHGAP